MHDDIIQAAWLFFAELNLLCPETPVSLFLYIVDEIFIIAQCPWMKISIKLKLWIIFTVFPFLLELLNMKNNSYHI